MSGRKDLDFDIVLKNSGGYLVETDKSRLKQIFINFLSNAIKFTKKGRIVFGMTDEIELNDLKIKFFVEDTGIGIPEDKINLIFERFTKFASTNDQLFRGVGLGLTITKSLVDFLGGKISIQSEQDKGTRIDFYIKVKSLEVKSIQ